jgi:hypothetical protein
LVGGRLSSPVHVAAAPYAREGSDRFSVTGARHCGRASCTGGYLCAVRRGSSRAARLCGDRGLSLAGFVQDGGAIGEVVGAVPGQDGAQQPDRARGAVGNAPPDAQPVRDKLI